jgi:2-polyprenyl-3-methyl-5-hydroxy-6-metoxy-1,4-benzoquinol methylase
MRALTENSAGNRKPDDDPCKRTPAAAAPGPASILIDAHVHHYPCFDTGAFYRHAEENFAAAARELGLGPSTICCLLFAETAAEQHVEALVRGAGVPGWQIRPTLDPAAIELTGAGRQPLWLIAGRQIVTAERVEVLALLIHTPIAQRRPLEATLDAIRAAGGIAVLPWGFGKWWGARGRLLDRTLETPSRGRFFLGDNGGRALGLPKPRAFEHAARRGIVVLPGSDPLPLPDEASRVASFGFVVEGAFDPARPATSLARILGSLDQQPRSFGHRIGPARSCSHQLRLRAKRSIVPPRLAHDTRTPDIETASAAYATRFAGPVGQYFLSTQERLVLDLLAATPGEQLEILEVGGGHLQLTPALLRAGHRVVVQGSTAACEAQVQGLASRYPGQVQFIAADLWSLPFPDRRFDAVIAVRLLAHVERHQDLLAEMARVSRDRLVIDFPPVLSANLLEPLMFALKRRLEGNTRPFFCYRTRELDQALDRCGFRRRRIRRQFLLPMVLHRIARAPALSAGLERIFSRLGFTALLGAPALLLARPATRAEA